MLAQSLPQKCHKKAATMGDLINVFDSLDYLCIQPFVAAFFAFTGIAPVDISIVKCYMCICFLDPHLGQVSMHDPKQPPLTADNYSSLSSMPSSFAKANKSLEFLHCWILAIYSSDNPFNNSFPWSSLLSPSKSAAFALE